MMLVTREFIGVAANMRRGYDRGNAAAPGFLDHRKRHFQRHRAVIHSRNDMTMNINHRLGKDEG